MPDFENKLMPLKIIEKVRKQSRKNKLRLCEGHNPQIKEVFKFYLQCRNFWFFNCLLIFSPPPSTNLSFDMGRSPVKLLDWALYGEESCKTVCTYMRHRCYEWYNGMEVKTTNKAVAVVWVDFGVSSWTGHLNVVPPPSHLGPFQPFWLLELSSANCRCRFTSLHFKPDCRF